jgi:hypothetical protein
MAEQKQFILRISPELWDELQRWAADELRSANAQIEYILRRAVEERKKGKGPAERAPEKRERIS